MFVPCFFFFTVRTSTHARTHAQAQARRIARARTCTHTHTHTRFRFAFFHKTSIIHGGISETICWEKTKCVGGGRSARRNLRRLKRNGASSPAVILVCPARICRGCFIARELRIEINCFSRTRLGLMKCKNKNNGFSRSGAVCVCFPSGITSSCVFNNILVV